MPSNRRLVTDQDFQEAMERRTPVRVFQNDHIIDSGGIIIRYDDRILAIQSGVSQISYHDRGTCEFFEMRKR